MAHTPGPWIIEEGKYSGNNWLIGSMFLGYSVQEDKNIYIHITTDHIHASQLGSTDVMDDLHLIAAAPELLEALEQVEWVDTDLEDVCPWCGGVKPNHAPDCSRQAAIRKARGEQCAQKG